MKKIFTYVFFAIFISNFSYAEWLQHFIGDDSSIGYHDKNTMRYANGYYYVWTLNSNYEPLLIDSKFHKSHMAYVKVDCTFRKWGILSITAFTDVMATGESIVSYNYDDDFDWEYAMPDSNGAYLLDSIC
tara:strand:+ start:419 stop:808 length:390 start_codon:yes stop_codon:yes gene_type:complete